MEAGEVWAYRAKAGVAVVPVAVVRVGTGRPPRVRIRHLAEEFEGREEWVPPARLKVPWEQVAGWLAREQRWEAVREVSRQARDTPEESAAELVFDWLPTPGLVDLGYGSRDVGVLAVPDVDALVAEVGIDREVLTGDRLAFIDDDGVLVAPWPVARIVAEHVAKRYADRIVAKVAKAEAKDRRKAIYGVDYPRRGGELQHISPEICAEVASRWVPAYELIRRWCGVEATDRYDELVALREEVRRLGGLVERAVGLLRQAGQQQPAADLERELGVPIATLQQNKVDQMRLSGP